jgi:hypothetical protein
LDAGVGEIAKWSLGQRIDPQERNVPIVVTQKLGVPLDYGCRVLETEVDSQLPIELFWNLSSNTDDLMGCLARNGFGRTFESAERTAIGDIDADDDRDPQGDTQNGQGELQGMVPKVPKAGLPE